MRRLQAVCAQALPWSTSFIGCPGIRAGEGIADFTQLFKEDGSRDAGRAATHSRGVSDWCSMDHHTGCHQLNRALAARVVTPGCQIGYMDHTGCHRLNVFVF
jgi:hypothetical protein